MRVAEKRKTASKPAITPKAQALLTAGKKNWRVKADD